MSKFKMDAVEIASSIHKGDFSKLYGKSFETCDNKSMEKRYTLNQIGDALFKFIESTNKRFDQIETRIDGIDARIDRIEARLDYNGLKKLPKNR